MHYKHLRILVVAWAAIFSSVPSFADQIKIESYKLSRVEAKKVDTYEGGSALAVYTHYDKPSSYLLLELSLDTDLIKLLRRKSHYTSLEAWFCDSPEDLAYIGVAQTGYVQGISVWDIDRLGVRGRVQSPNYKGKVRSADIEFARKIAQRENLNYEFILLPKQSADIEIQMGLRKRGSSQTHYLKHDLYTSPQDICVKISGGLNFFSRSKSNTIRIPAQKLKDALLR